MSDTDRLGAQQDRHDLMAALAQFQVPSLRRSIWQFASTFIGYITLSAVMYVLVRHSVGMTMIVALPAAGFLVRLFIVQHDCGHGSFFRSRRMNDALGCFCSVFTFTPYTFWRRQHANHHASFNNLDRRDSDIDLYSTCATLAEYQAMPYARRALYRAVRHPILTQVLLPPLVFVLLYRIPFEAPRTWWRERRGVLMTNIALGATLAGLTAIFGLRAVALVQLPIISIASIIGVWVFSVQHRFEGAIWERQEGWSHLQASLEGSSYLKLPKVLQWFTGNIGFHHVHHLCARVPNYRLQECHAARREFQGVTTLTLRQALSAPCYALWDEEHRRMVRFPASAVLHGDDAPQPTVREGRGTTPR
jgi:omega-6 fatty acid desaturase (delta-12 desaturase)